MPIRKRCVPCALAHHQDAYNEHAGADTSNRNVNYEFVANDVTILSQAITITETCVVVAVGTILANNDLAVTSFDLEQPEGTVVADQENLLISSGLGMFHYASWRVLSAGTYTYFLKNRSGSTYAIYGAQLKLVAVEA